MRQAFVILYEGYDENHLKFFEYLKLENFEMIYVGLSEHDLGGHRIDMSLQDLSRRTPDPQDIDYDEYDILFIPGAVDSTTEVTDGFIDKLASIVKWSRIIVAIDLAIFWVIRTRALPDESSCMVATPESNPVQAEIWKSTTEVQWESRSVFFHGSLWTTSSGTQENLRWLAFLLKQARRGEWGDGGFRLFSKPTLERWKDIIAENESPDECQSEEAAKRIRGEDGLSLFVASLIFGFAAKLAVQGFLEVGNSILTALSDELPNEVAVIPPYAWGFEFLWDSTGTRPNVRWEKPTQERLDEMAVHFHESLPSKYTWPSTLEARLDALDQTDMYISMGEIPEWPYSMPRAAIIAVEIGDPNRAKKYLGLGIQLIVAQQRLYQWFKLIEYRALAPLILEEGARHAAGQTAEGAQRDAETIIAAFRSWATTREPRRQAREAKARKFAALSLEEILAMLEPLKADDDESLRKAPAAAKDISEAEERLGVALPEDYREFLLLSNGMNFMPSRELPGLRPVEELRWEEASELGIDELELSLGLKVDEQESQMLPKMGRLLMISSADDEEQIWLLEPSQVENVLQILKAERKLSRYSQPLGWRMVVWRHWSPVPIWFRSFRGYLESTAKKAELEMHT